MFQSFFPSFALPKYGVITQTGAKLTGVPLFGILYEKEAFELLLIEDHSRSQ